MTFTGLLLLEGLEDKDILDDLQISKIEKWHPRRPAPFQPAVWTAVTFEGKAAEADLVAEQISRKMKPVGWYTNISTDCDAYVIFTNRVFKYSKGDQEGRAAAQAHARSVGVPEWQLDWSD